MPQQVTLSWQSDMQLAGKLVLSATALFLLTLAYRFYKSRSLAGGKIPPAEAEEEQRENAARDGDGARGLRRRRVGGEEAGRDGGDEGASGQVSASETRCTLLRGNRGLPRGEEGEEMVSELELSCGRVGVVGKGSELGSKMGRELGSEQESDQASKSEYKLGSELGSKPGSKLESKMGGEPGSNMGSELGSLMGNKVGNKMGSKLGSEPGSKSGNKTGIELGSELGSKTGSELGSEPVSKSEKKPGIDLGSKMGSELGSKMRGKPGIELGSETGSELGSESGNKPGIELRSKPSSYDPGDAAEKLSSHREEGTLVPSTGLSPGIGNAQTADDGHTQSMEKELTITNMSQEAERHAGMIQTLSVTSDLGLTMTASDMGSDDSYSFSSVAKIQVEESYITRRQAKDGAQQPIPGLKGKVYDYYVQSISQSVSKKRSLSYIPPETSQHLSLEWVNEEPQCFETQELDPTSATWDSTTSSIEPPPSGNLEISSEPPSPGRKDSILQIADSPHLQLSMEGFGVMALARTPPASPQPGPVTSANLFQMPPPTHLDLGNCYKVLCTAKAQKLGHLQEAAYKVMSDNYLQVLRTPSIYSHLNASERELILRQRMKGKTYMAVADINMQEPGLHTSHLCYYDDKGDCWRHLCHVPPEVVSRGCAMCSMFNYLFVVAGCEGMGQDQRPSNRVFCYDPLTNIWKEICSLNQARPHCKLVALDGHLYAIGGECLNTVERYDPRQDRWTFTAPLPHETFAVAHTATVCDGEIYVTGGTLRYMLLRYTARSDSWSISPAGGGKDRTAEMVSTNGFIYRFDLHRSTGISVYRCSAKAKLWYKCAVYAMPDPPGFQCTVVGSLVHCVGRHFHIRFLADHISPRFGTKELQPFPSPRSSLLPAVLVLPEGETAQTKV
ncbi:PREDICTED: kelch domain-containing protein 7A [Mesitornis unicolor]|uniref:kelch domain-containing protein 7A n=1 Tax=Mesitornis unicolor TaxID=54374 RepID=UPI000528049F|nr:PREDICTED: kelch domain-containing protein 7A [Mesitornis unicolor]